MARKNKERLEEEKQEAARKETALRGKALDSEPDFGRPTRHQATSSSKAKGKAAKGSKSAAPTADTEQNSGSDEAPAPLKRARTSTSKGKGIAIEGDGPEDRDRSAKPTPAQLYKHLTDHVTWVPTRFADVSMMEALEISEDVKQLLRNLRMEGFHSMAYPTFSEVSCQFLATLEVTFYHDTEHSRQGWGNIKFKVNGKTHYMSFREIGQILGLQDYEDSILPKGNPGQVWKLLSGNLHATGSNKNSSIRHPAIRYFHRVLVHAFYPRKEPGQVNEEELRLIGQAIKEYVPPADLPIPSDDEYEDFGMVGFLMRRFMFYKNLVWTTFDKKPKVGIGGLITPLLMAAGVDLGNDEAGPSFIDAPYLRIASYLKGLYDGRYVYTYHLKKKEVELLLPNHELTRIDRPGGVKFEISSTQLLGPHGALDSISAPRGKGAGTGRPSAPEDPAETSEPIYGPPRYYFEQHTGALPKGPLRDAHDYIGKLQRWNKAQDRTIFKLKTKYKELKRTMKKQAEASAQFMKKVTDMLVKGGVAGCSHADFLVRDTSDPQPRHSHTGDPQVLSARQRERLRRNPPVPPSDSGNNSPSLNLTDEEEDTEEVGEEHDMAITEYAPRYYTTFPDEDGSPPSHHDF